MSGDTFQCPHCHNTIQAMPARGGASAGWGVPYQQHMMQRRDFNIFGKGKSKDVGQAERRVPLSHARPSFESSFKTPLSISLATGSFFLLGSLLLGFELKLVLGAGLIVSFATWYWQIKGDRSLLSIVEKTLTNRDIDGDDHVGEPPEPQKNLRVTVTEKQKGSKSWTGYFESPIDEPVLGEYARAILLNRTTGEREWTGEGRPFSIDGYITFRDELMERGLFRWKNKKSVNQGFKLTARGRAVFKELAAIPATTPPELLQ